MDAIAITQSKLDKVLLSHGVTSHHLRRVKVDYIERDGRRIKASEDEYVVFRLISNPPRRYGDGKPLTDRAYVDVNYYYSYEKTDSRYKDVRARIKAIIKEFLSDSKIRLANGESDIYDLDNPYRGINVEFLFIGVFDYGG